MTSLIMQGFVKIYAKIFKIKHFSKIKLSRD